MAQTNINIRMDEDLKKEFDLFCNSVGMSMTAAVNIFAKTAVRQQRIPFEIVADPFYSQKNQQRLEKSANSLNAGLGVQHELIETND